MKIHIEDKTDVLKRRGDENEQHAVNNKDHFGRVIDVEVENRPPGREVFDASKDVNGEALVPVDHEPHR